MEEEVYFLALVELAAENSVSTVDKTIPVAKFNKNSRQNKYCIIRLEDIVCSIGLLKTLNSSALSIITHHIFKTDLSLTAGSVSNL